MIIMIAQQLEFINSPTWINPINIVNCFTESKGWETLPEVFIITVILSYEVQKKCRPGHPKDSTGIDERR